MADGTRNSSGMTPEQDRHREEMKERGRDRRAGLDAKAVDVDTVAWIARRERLRQDEWLKRWLPHRIDQGMEATGLTVRSLSQLAGFASENTLHSKMKSGSFKFSDVLAIATVFRVKLDWFRSNAPFPESEDDYWHVRSTPTNGPHTLI